MNIDKWSYRCEGNAGIAISNKKSILRLIKQLTEDLERETVKKLKLEDQSSFIIDNQLSFAEHVIKPLMRRNYIVPMHKVPLPYGFVEKIASRIQIFRPSHRLSKGLSPSLSHAIKMPDLCFLRTSFRNTLKCKRSREGGHEECCGTLASEYPVGTTNYDNNNNNSINMTVFGHVNADDSNSVSVISDNNNNDNKNDSTSHQSDKCNDEMKTTKVPTELASTSKIGNCDFNSGVAVKTGNNNDGVNNNNNFCDIGNRNQSINKSKVDDNLYKHAAEHDSMYSSLFIADSGYEDDDEEDDTFTVEIKPKWGFLPRISDDFEVKKYVCRYCMHQAEKVSSGKYKYKSQFCPIDFFSGCRTRMSHSIESLFRSPQNNCKVFQNGHIILNEFKNENFENAVRDWVLRNCSSVNQTASNQSTSITANNQSTSSTANNQSTKADAINSNQPKENHCASSLNQPCDELNTNNDSINNNDNSACDDLLPSDPTSLNQSALKQLIGLLVECLLHVNNNLSGCNYDYDEKNVANVDGNEVDSNYGDDDNDEDGENRKCYVNQKNDINIKNCCSVRTNNDQNISRDVLVHDTENEDVDQGGGAEVLICRESKFFKEPCCEGKNGSCCGLPSDCVLSCVLSCQKLDCNLTLKHIHSSYKVVCHYFNTHQDSRQKCTIHGPYDEGWLRNCPLEEIKTEILDIKKFLTARSAKDCSIIVSLSSSKSKKHLVKSCDNIFILGDSKEIIANVSIIDLDMKDFHKIPSYLDEDQTIVNCYESQQCF